MSKRVFKSHRSKMGVSVIYILVKKTDNMSSRLLPVCQWPHGNPYTWAHDVRLLWVTMGLLYVCMYICMYVCMYIYTCMKNRIGFLSIHSFLFIYFWQVLTFLTKPFTKSEFIFLKKFLTSNRPLFIEGVQLPHRWRGVKRYFLLLSPQKFLALN